MSFAKLKEIVGDNTEALGLITALETNTNTLTEKVNTLEIKFEDVKASRDKVKGSLRTAKELLGVDEINEETIGTFKTAKPDEKLQLELDNYKSQLDAANNKVTEVESSFKSKLNQMQLDSELTNIGLSADVRSPEMLQIVKGLLKDGLSFEEGKVVYKKADGTTDFTTEGQPVTIQSKLEAIKTNEAYAGLFKPVNEDGGSGSGKGGGKGGKSFAEMNEQERIALYKSNPEEFRRLQKQ